MNWYKKAQNFTYDNDDERTTISSPYGSVIVTETTPRYEFSDDMNPEEFEKLGIDEDDFIAKIEHIAVDPEKMGQGIGTSLMQEAMKEIARKGMKYVYLNASPMGFDGLRLPDLTEFYEKFGFKVIKEQGNNNLMGLKEPPLLESAKDMLPPGTTDVYELERGRSARGKSQCPKCQTPCDVASCSDVGGVWYHCPNCGVVDI